MQRTSMPTGRRPVVLLVQPSRDDGLEMYTEFLRYHGLAVIPVSDTRNALMLAPQADIVVTGMNLDDPMDGVELVSRLRHNDRTRSTPIIVLTACVWPKERVRAEGAGCDVFLPKPCLPNDLLREVWQLLTATRPQAADTPHVFQLPSHRAARRALGWHAAHRLSRVLTRSS
jgi:two-component system cell cycle response regulator DivK